MLTTLKLFLKKEQILFQYLAVFILLVAFMPKSSDTGFDLICWTTWANYIQANGLENIYKFGVDYPPLYHYVLFLFGKVYPTSELIALNIKSLKYVTLFFDFIGVYYVFKLVKYRYSSINHAFFATLIILLNIAYLYNNIFYGQVDALFSSMVFLSFYFAIQKKKTLSIIFIVLAVNFKLQAIIFFPFIALLILPQFYNQWSLKKTLINIIPAFIVQIAIISPFLFLGDFNSLIGVFTSSLGRYPLVSMGAYNIWSLFVDNPTHTHDKVYGIYGHSYNKIGLIIFSLFLFLGLIKLIVFDLKNFTQNKVSIPVEKLLLIGSIISFVFFYFNTQMHSRYIHPSMLFLGAYALFSKRFHSFALLSLAYFLNIEDSIKVLKGNFSSYTQFYFDPKFISFLYLCTFLMMLYDLFILKGSKYKFKLSSKNKKNTIDKEL